MNELDKYYNYEVAEDIKEETTKTAIEKNFTFILFKRKSPAQKRWERYVRERLNKKRYNEYLKETKKKINDTTIFSTSVEISCDEKDETDVRYYDAVCHTLAYDGFKIEKTKKESFNGYYHYEIVFKISW